MESGDGGPQLSATPETAEKEFDKAKAKVDLEEAEAKARKLGAEADKAVADARAAAYPKPTAKPLEGKVDVGDKVGLVADLVSHALLEEAGRRIAKDLKGLQKETTKILLVGSTDLLSSDWPYMVVKGQISHEKGELEALCGQVVEATGKLGGTPPAEEEHRAEGDFRAAFVAPLAVAGTLQAASSMVGAVADIASWFRADYGISARDVSIGSPPLFAAVARELQDKVKEINVDGLSLLENSSIFSSFDEVARLRTKLQIEATVLKERLADLKGASESDGDGQAAERASARALVTVSEGAIQRFDAFAAAVVKVPEKGYSPLVAAAVRERLHDRQNGYTHVLYAGVEAAGGESLTRQTFISSQMRFMGGAEVSYFLWSVAEERLVGAGTMPLLGEIKMSLRSGFEGKVRFQALDRG